MMRRKKEYPHVYHVKDRHGNFRWRFIRRGANPFSCYLPGEYGSTEFIQAHEKAMGGRKVKANSARYGTMNWVIEQYLASPKFKKIADSAKKTKIGKINTVRELLGEALVKDIRPKHIEKIHDVRYKTPAAADALLKLLRQLLEAAIKKELVATNVAKAHDLYNMPSDGFYTWTNADIAQFENFHGAESKAVLAMRFALYTGAARQDVVGLGWQSIKVGRDGKHRIFYRRGKTGQEASLPIHHELAEVLNLADRETLLFVHHGRGEAYQPTSFGNWFKDKCKEAGLDQCNSHGLRKAGATRLAEAGANELEIMAFLGHKDTKEAITYVQGGESRNAGRFWLQKAG